MWFSQVEAEVDGQTVPLKEFKKMLMYIQWWHCSYNCDKLAEMDGTLDRKLWLDVNNVSTKDYNSNIPERTESQNLDMLVCKGSH
jgi:hypothetical protein